MSIREKVYLIRAQIQTKSFDQLKTTHFDFFEKYPKLFEAATNPTFDLKYFETMLDHMDMINKNQLNVEEADKIIYTQLKKEYVDPYFPEDENAYVNQQKL